MKRYSIRIWSTVAIIVLLVAGVGLLRGNSSQHQSDETDLQSATDLAAQVELLQTKIRRLEDQLALENGSGPSGAMSMSGKGNMGMGTANKKGMGMSKTGMMSGMSSMSPGMGGMKQKMPGGMGKGMGGMSMMGKMKGMGSDSASNMKMGGMSSMSVDSTLPGFPGSSHLYHIGATGFFLDHTDHIELTTQQLARLSQIKEKALLEQASAERNVEEAEQALWELTAAENPDVRAIEAQIRTIEKKRADQRMAFFRAVGDAAGVLTPVQRAALTGSATDVGTTDHSAH